MHELLWIKLGRRRRGNDERAVCGVHVTIGQAKGVAGENARVSQIHNGMVVHCVTGRVDELELPSGQAQTLKVSGDVHAFLRHGHNLTV